jgi:hypothetical protein
MHCVRRNTFGNTGLKKKRKERVTGTKVGELNSTFALNLNVFLLFLYHARLLSDIEL